MGATRLATALLLMSLTTVLAAETTIVDVSASSFQHGNPQEHAFDADPTTRWAANGRGQWLECSLSSPVNGSELKIGFFRSDRRYRFVVSVATGKGPLQAVGSFVSDGEGGKRESFSFDQPTRFDRLRLTFQGSDANDWANVHSVEVAGVAPRLVKRTARKIASPAPLEFSKWSGDVNVPDPVAISFDPQGRAYVTQTQRRKSEDLDIRAHRDWIPEDLRLQTVDDKRAFYHRVLAPAREIIDRRSQPRWLD